MNNVKAYVSSKPKYKSKYYGTGYPNDHFGVCSDVVAFGLKDAGYDLMELVNQHVQNHKEDYEYRYYWTKILILEGCKTWRFISNINDTII